ncbi:uncharacterized protein [Vulpes vulpes]|uniref:10 kDa heat shock protein, mitochondrial n=1 Tax=Vulpes vulpes TaxID=9627 RepID=A0ABM4YCM3_VULVU
MPQSGNINKEERERPYRHTELLHPELASSNTVVSEAPSITQAGDTYIQHPCWAFLGHLSPALEAEELSLAAPAVTGPIPFPLPFRFCYTWLTPEHQRLEGKCRLPYSIPAWGCEVSELKTKKRDCGSPGGSGGSRAAGTAAAGGTAGQAFRKFLPLFDWVLVERSAAETVTKGGIMLPEKSQGKVLQATVVAVGSGSKGKGGEIQPVSVKVGNKVLLPEYGGTKVVLDDKDYFLFRDGDILGKYVD